MRSGLCAVALSYQVVVVLAAGVAGAATWQVAPAVWGLLQVRMPRGAVAGSARPGWRAPVSAVRTCPSLSENNPSKPEVKNDASTDFEPVPWRVLGHSPG